MVDSPVMFIAEAPGRFGADRTSIPIHGDPTGNNFERLLAEVGWTRDDVFVTNCVLCNPRDEKGNNRTPTTEEIHNCSFHLDQQIRLVDPLVIVTLGASALAAISSIYPHGLTLSQAVASPREWNGKILFPMYHQSPRAMIHRGYSQQLNDFKKLKALVDSL
jgi:uracil-DNA glycosylase family 4